MAVPLPNRGDVNYDEVLNAGIWQVESESQARDDSLSQRISDTGWVDAFDFMTPGAWFGLARLRRVLSVVYFEFGLTSDVGIAGTAKTDDVLLLDFGIDGTWQPSEITGIRALAGTGIDDAGTLLRVKFTSASQVVISGDITGIEATGNWLSDDTTYVEGQVSWLTAP